MGVLSSKSSRLEIWFNEHESFLMPRRAGLMAEAGLFEGGVSSSMLIEPQFGPVSFPLRRRRQRRGDRFDIVSLCVSV